MTEIYDTGYVPEGTFPSDEGPVQAVSPPPQTRITRPEGTDGYDAYQVPVVLGGPVVSLGGDDGERRALTILVTTPGRSIVFGKRSAVSSGNGFVLPAGTLMPLSTYREVYAAVPAGTVAPEPVMVSVLVERNKS